MNDLDLFMTQVALNNVPDAFNLNCHKYSEMVGAYSSRQYVTSTKGMWGIVDLQWTKKLSEFIGDRTCLEVMAGAGWLAKALSIHGVDIHATDNYKNHQKTRFKTVYDVEKMDAVKAAKKYHNKEILIMSWPPYRDSIAFNTLRAWHNNKSPSHQTVIYIGEGWDGCTADDKFHKHFHIEKDCDDLGIEYPNWFGIHDTVFVGHFI